MDYPANQKARELQTQGMRDTDLDSQLEVTEALVVPVLKEEIEVHKELRKTGTVRIHKTVRELEQVVSENLISEAVDVQRTPINQIVNALPEVRTEGDVMIVPVVKEELVVTKQLRLVEELRITKRRVVSDYRENVTLRAEEVTVERVGSEPLRAEAGKA